MISESMSSRQESGAGTGPNGQGLRDVSPAPAGSETPQGDTIVNDAVNLLDSTVDYFASIFRLERYRIEVQARGLVRKALILVCGAAVLLLGLVFASVGVSSLLSESLRAPYAGPLIVGGVYLVIGLIAVMVAARKKES